MAKSQLSNSALWIRHIDRGRLYLHRGEFEKAIAELNKAIALDAENSAPGRSGMAYYLRGMCYARLNDLSAAARDFEKAWLIDQKLLYYESMEKIKREIIARETLQAQTGG